METEPSTNGSNGLAEARDSKGRFLPGNPGGPGNPNACNVHAWRRMLADSVSADDVAEIARRLVAAARAGEPWAVHEVLDRCLGKPRVQIDLQADPGAAREYNEREAEDARKITAILLAQAQDSERQGTPQPPTPPGLEGR